LHFFSLLWVGVRNFSQEIARLLCFALYNGRLATHQYDARLEAAIHTCITTRQIIIKIKTQQQ
jgi:hypothetical protein